MSKSNIDYEEYGITLDYIGSLLNRAIEQILPKGEQRKNLLLRAKSFFEHN